MYKIRCYTFGYEKRDLHLLFPGCETDFSHVYSVIFIINLTPVTDLLLIDADKNYEDSLCAINISSLSTKIRKLAGVCSYKHN